MNPCFPPSHYQAGLGYLPSFSSNSHQTNDVIPLPYPLVSTDASGTRLSPEGLAHHGQTPTKAKTAKTERKHRKSSEVSDTGEERPRKCHLCDKWILASEFRRHPKRCSKRPNRVEVKCPQCSRILSRDDSLKRHLEHACPNRPQANPASTSGLGPSRVTRKKHRATPYTPSPPSSASPPTPVDRLPPLTIPNNKTPHLPYTNNHYALYISRQTARSPPLLHSPSPPIPPNFPGSSLPMAYGRNYLASFSQHAPTAQVSSEYWLNTSATAPLSYGCGLTWPPTSSALEALPERDESWCTDPRLILPAHSGSTPADGQLANGWYDSPPVESLDFQAAPSTLTNQEESFLPFDYDLGDQAQYQGAVPQSAQEYNYFSGQPMFDESQLGLATFRTGPSQPRTMLEELESPSIVGDNDVGGQASTGYRNYPQFMDLLPTFQAVPTPTHGISGAVSAVTISDKDIQAIGSTVNGALRTSMEAPVILELARILASTGQPEGSF